jgi:hypothetical protein
MSVMNPIWAAALRRQWAALLALLVLVVFLVVHQLWFRPTATRYARSLKEAADLGMALDPDQMPKLIPPRLFALVSQNSLPLRVAQDEAASGNLTAEFVGELSQIMERRGVHVLSTEPAPMTQDDNSVQVRGHVRASCRYPELVGLFDELATSQRLISVDRLNAVPEDNGTISLEVWASRFILKAGGKR